MNNLEKHGIETGDMQGLKNEYKSRFERSNLRKILQEKLVNEQFPADSEHEHFFTVIHQLVENASAMFPDLSDFRLFIRRIHKLLPQRIDDVSSTTLRNAEKHFHFLRDNTDKIRLSADIEIKIRAIYFDRIERTAVAALIESIYQHVHTLEDLQFLVKFSTALFPAHGPQGVTGESILKNIEALQTELREKRNVSILGMINVMTQLYPEQEYSIIQERAMQICKVYQIERFITEKEQNVINQIVTDSAQIFPPDFISATPEYISEKKRTRV
jgi:hypothetical protein